MKDTTRKILEETIARYPILSENAGDIECAFTLLKTCFEKGNRVYLCGNGGSCADCEHMAGELLKSFKKARPLSAEKIERLRSLGEDGEKLVGGLESGLPVISLCGHTAFSTAFLNDKDPIFTFAQQVNVWGKEGDVLIAFSTSGNSKNCVYAAIVAKASGLQTVFLGGGTGGKLKAISDVSIVVPEKETYKVQELHLPTYHCLCAMLEEEFF